MLPTVSSSAAPPVRPLRARLSRRFSGNSRNASNPAHSTETTNGWTMRSSAYPRTTAVTEANTRG